MRKSKKPEPNVKGSPPMQKALACIKAFRTTGTLTDLQGSYTGLYKDSPRLSRDAGQMGIPQNKKGTESMIVDLDNKVPVQDMDDL